MTTEAEVGGTWPPAKECPECLRRGRGWGKAQLLPRSPGVRRDWAEALASGCSCQGLVAAGLSFCGRGRWLAQPQESNGSAPARRRHRRCVPKTDAIVFIEVGVRVAPCQVCPIISLLGSLITTFLKGTAATRREFRSSLCAREQCSKSHLVRGELGAT